ncbi:hypothetical protein SERLA73DRAFT_188476 [Serpula lacrymans var. lacrymans S7.3]|uniref:Uncharacterized protein n=2 Tax=Serpula lacrymans var. lacrymans TaxID=341189 RepID=F8QBE0_SERL3|nr:uncharacterized protein SERLADRAFT_478603 [Serpula lacrymans var. lacrymans S7.9]EGN94526.1 hypothetical protein SERLA73DRAFT_188476 [Serpula lacrymans var. lacrymans S7.3]EGO20007.1 hypothetical protein SERLADRAFT_478603 [Serpula lacrymans var. lacrymans S7.9]
MIQKTMNSLHLLYKWSGTAEAKFTIKYTIVSVLLWLPSVFHSSAQFYYVQKGVWALIMAQTTMNIYASDQIFNYVIRLVGTFVGLCLGLVTWYIGSGRGIGNPYGVAASSAVFLIPVVWLRLFAPAKYLPGVLIGGATFALVVGYSWIDGHLQTVGNPGIGWSIAWRRWVLVVIGSAASFIMMMLPPTSGRKAVRLRNAAVISKISNMYAFLVSTWIETEHREKPSRRAHASEAWLSEFRLRLKALAEQVQSVRQLTDMAKWEGNIRGAWPLKEYNELADAESEMLNAIAQLGSAIAHLDDDWRIKFLHKTKVVHPNFISDVLTKFTVVSQSLRTGEAMHQVLPRSLLDRLFYHNRIANIAHVAGEDSVDVEALRSLDYVYYASGIVAVSQLLMHWTKCTALRKGYAEKCHFKATNAGKNNMNRHTFWHSPVGEDWGSQ